MVKVKDFKVGQEAYTLRLANATGRYGDIENASIVTVEKVGRLYVTCNDGIRYEVNGTCEFGLASEGSSGWCALFPSKEAIEKELERRKLAHWLGDKSFFSVKRYSLEQLQKVKEILEE